MRDVRLLLLAFAYTVAMRLAVWFLPTRSLLRFVRERVEATPTDQPGASASIARIAWSVRAAGRRIPRATCLVEALAVQLMLARSGHRSELRIGVLRDPEGKFAAHAWVEAAGKIVVGGRRGMQYQVLPDLAHTLR